SGLFAYQIGQQVCLALRDLHAQNIVHGDIKLENVFYDPNNRAAKIGDAGLIQ
ncbi:MAG: protein kinase family protein, partial [bacterium]|nr:protein kinase family protein [bacterium]